MIPKNSMTQMTNFFRQLVFRAALALTISLLIVSVTWAAPKAELWPKWQKHDPSSTQKIDHGPWDTFLKKYLVAPHPSGINRLPYDAVSPEDGKASKTYLQNL